MELKPCARIAATMALLLAGWVTASSALAADPPNAKAAQQAAATAAAQRQALIDDGRKAASFCANCHGESGISATPEVPNLAGQHPLYLRKQIDAFVTGTRKNSFMQGLMKLLSERDKAAIVQYYADSAVTPSMPTPGPLAAQGAELYAKHCARCHQPDARGAETFPRLAGQQQEYLRINLKRYLTQSGERLYTPMTAVVMKLGEQNIEPVTQYLAGLR